MVVGVCKYCGKETELIKSHIIPKCLYRLDETGPLIGVDNKKEIFDKNPKGQNGVKEYLLCRECDNHIGKLDNYANKVFKEIIPKHKWEEIHGIETCRLTKDEVDICKFKQFIISVMWRLSIYSRGIPLGVYEEIALKTLKGELPEDENIFLPLIYEKSTNTPLDNSSGTFSNKTFGKRIYMVHIPHYEIMVIPCIKHSKCNAQMNYFKQFYTSNEILVHRFNTIPSFELQLMNLLGKCYQKEIK